MDQARRSRTFGLAAVKISAYSGAAAATSMARRPTGEVWVRRFRPPIPTLRLTPMRRLGRGFHPAGLASGEVSGAGSRRPFARWYDHGYTDAMKTAISLPDEVFRRVERQARRLGLSRSEFFARAAERFLQALREDAVTASYDEAFGPPEGADVTFRRRAARTALLNVEWEE